MAITKNGEGVIVETPVNQKDQFERSGVIRDDSFAIRDDIDVTKQMKFDVGSQATNCAVTLKAGANASNITLTLPAVTGTLVTADQAGGNSFSIIQPDEGTSPTAEQVGDTLTITSPDGSVLVEGTSGTDTLELSVVGKLSLGGGVIDGNLEVVNQDGNGIPFIVKAHGSQFANIAEIQNASGTPLAAFGLDGTFSAPNFTGSSAGTNTGDVTIGTANGLSRVGQVLSLQAATSGQAGALTAADWTTFNNKVAKAGDTMTGQLVVDVPSNTTGIQIEMHAGQDAAPLVIRDSSTATVARITATGGFIGDYCQGEILSETGFEAWKDNYGTGSRILKLDNSNGAFGVGVDAHSLGGRLNVQGTDDRIQTLIRGNATQTSNIFEIENSGGSNLLTVSNAGAVAAAGAVTGSNLSGTNTGDVTTAANSGLSLSSQAISVDAFALLNSVLGISKYLWVKDDWLHHSSGDLLWTAQQSGSGAGTTHITTGSAQHPGIVRLSTGTTTTGFCGQYTLSGNSSIILGAGKTHLQAVLTLSAASDGTDTYYSNVGLFDATTPNPNNGIYFRYTHSENSGKWQGFCANGGSRTSVDLGITPAGGTWTRFGWELNSAGTSVQFYVDGVATGSAITTNIPTGALIPRHYIIKTAGTTNRDLDIDAWQLVQEFSTPR